MKKIILMFILFFASYVTVNAQTADAETRATNQTKLMTDNLSLTNEQKAKVFLINLEKNKQVDAAKAKHANHKEFKVEREKINELRYKELEAVLTAEQNTKWAQLKEKAKQMNNEDSK
ncbi:MAG: hypothetical protein JNL69_00420 [Bacteroidia bacterium]|nr:hypothetical protein [Bacteroidia bacterium]